ncbi:MAG TPA: 5-(carboxyamino)imidazole ribonucleotide synthase [Longimicrobiaceae bacterium]|nr:5-(carboxyamino)imidazole ribonucleotide synthase [Longimicrobiaceae bacterium]
MSRGPVLPGATVGVVGGGQLGRMLALEARRMGYRTLVLDPAGDAPAAQVADGHIHARLNDPEAVRELAHRSEVVTLEWENADVHGLRALPGETRLHPGPHVLEVAQHRVREKDAARRLGLPTADYRPVSSLDELRAAVREIGTPAVLKTARWGYDGKGQAVLRSPAEAEAAFAALGPPGTELILEAFVPFRMEVSVVCARTERGETASFPVAENVHRHGILDLTVVPARVPESVAHEAARIAEALAEGLEVVGVLAVEMFVEEDDTIRVNEIAPRPHNSGHYTWEACAVSQFEQQLRAVCALPLGSPDLLRPAAMVNLLGEHIGNGEGLPQWAEVLRDPAVAVHLYGKREGKPGRKMGHLTVLAGTPDEAAARALEARRRLTNPR